MSAKTLLLLLRAWWNYYAGNRDYRIWQCMAHDKGETGNCCHRLKGHGGKHLSYSGSEWL